MTGTRMSTPAAGRWCLVAMALLGGALLAAPPAAAQGSHPIAGVVRDSAARIAISGAEVAVQGTTQRVRTGEDGTFQVLPAAGGSSTLVVRRLGFRPVAVPVSEVPEQLEVLLVATALDLDPIVVRAAPTRYTGRLAGYYERLEKRTTGQFITRADIERERPPQLTDMLQRMPGVRITRGRPGAQSIRMRGRDCRPLVWLDGAPMSAGDVDLDAYSPTALEGIEIYLGANPPPRYQAARGQSECGTLLLWSRGSDTEPPRRRSDVSPAELEQLLASLSVYRADQVDSVARRVEGDAWVVPYPPSLQASGTSGVVIAEFVVGVSGFAEPGKFGIVMSTNPFFSAAVAEAVAAARFRPAMRAGRPVRQLVRQSFEFRRVHAER